MNKIKIGILGPSEIAFRRFMPAILKDERFEYVGLAVASETEWFGEVKDSNNLQVLHNEMKKANQFVDQFGGVIFDSYESLLKSEINAVYIPLPPALHFKWAMKALNQEKHVFVEKPSTSTLRDTTELIESAKSRKLALHENYMFVYHSQIEHILNKINNNDFGTIRLFRIAFGFPFRGSNDFRYHKKLGGGALLDCGGYTIKLAQILLGESARIDTSKLNYDYKADVDMHGSLTMSNNDGVVAQLSFGMDNTYKNELEIWGSKERLFTNRIFTAPAGFEPTILIENEIGQNSYKINSDDTFMKSINHFYQCIMNDKIRTDNYTSIYRQSKFVQEINDKEISK